MPHLLRQPRQGEILQGQYDQFHYIQVGDPLGRDIVMLHGCGSLGEEIVLPLEATKYRITALDRPGYGFSSPLPPEHAGPFAQAEWLARFLDERQLERPIIVAHSFGAAVALQLSALRPDLVRGLVLIAPCVRPVSYKSLAILRMAVTPLLGPFVRRHVLTRWSGYFVTRALLSACRPNPLPLALNGLVAAHVLTPASLLTMASEVRAFNADMSQLPNVQTELPVSVLFGDADRVIDPDWHIDFLASRFQNLSIHRMPGVGHMPHHIAPDLLANMLDEMDELTRAFDKRPQAVA